MHQHGGSHRQRNISTNICGLEERTDLKLGEVSSLFIFNRITISWLYPLNGFWFISLWANSNYPAEQIPYLWTGTLKTFTQSFDSFAILSSRNYPSRNMTHWPSYTRTVSGSVCLNAEKMASLINIFDMSFLFGIDLAIVERSVCGIAHCTWLGFEEKYEGKFLVGHSTK